MVPYLLRDFFNQLRLKVQGKGFEPQFTGTTGIDRKILLAFWLSINLISYKDFSIVLDMDAKCVFHVKYDKGKSL
jgi:hypothetical protein